MGIAFAEDTPRQPEPTPSCPEGTIFKDNTCIGGEPICGEGTTYQDGICVVTENNENNENNVSGKWEQGLQNRGIDSPLKQTQSGISFNEIQCKQNLVLIQKYDGSPACVTESTKTKLIERGWTDTSNFQIRTPVSMPVPSDPMSITINGSHTSLIIPIKTGETKEIDILLEPKIPIMSSIVNVESYFGSAGECKDIDIDTYCPGRGIDMFLSDTSITSQKEITLTISISDNMTGGTYAYKIETETIFESPDSGELRTVGNSIRFDLNVE